MAGDEWMAGVEWHKTVEILKDHRVIRTPLGVYDVWFRIEEQPGQYVEAPGFYLMGAWHFKRNWASGDHADEVLSDPPDWWRDLEDGEKYVQHKRTQDDPAHPD